MNLFFVVLIQSYGIKIIVVQKRVVLSFKILIFKFNNFWIGLIALGQFCHGEFKSGSENQESIIRNSEPKPYKRS